MKVNGRIEKSRMDKIFVILYIINLEEKLYWGLDDCEFCGSYMKFKMYKISI